MTLRLTTLALLLFTCWAPLTLLPSSWDGSPSASLLLDYLGTGVRAQMVTPATPAAETKGQRERAFPGTATMVCEVFRNRIVINISTENEYTTVVYLDNRRVRGNTPIAENALVLTFERKSRYDMRPIQRQLNQLLAREWVLTGQEHSMQRVAAEDSAPFETDLLMERHIYSFSIPAERRKAGETGTLGGDVLLTTTNDNRQVGFFGRRFSLVRMPDETFRFRHEVDNGLGYALLAEMRDAPFLAPEHVAQLTDLRLAGDQLEMTYVIDEHRYVYVFEPGEMGYQLKTVSYEAAPGAQCGLFSYIANWQGTSVLLQGKRNAGDCTGEMKEKRVQERLVALPTRLSKFAPGTQYFNFSSPELSAIY